MVAIDGGRSLKVVQAVLGARGAWVDGKRRRKGAGSARQPLLGKSSPPGRVALHFRQSPSQAGLGSVESPAAIDAAAGGGQALTTQSQQGDHEHRDEHAEEEEVG